MGLSLKKGQTISLRKKDTKKGLERVHLGLGWDPIAPQGFFARLFSSGDIDLDASCLMYDANKTLKDTIYYGQLRSKDGSVTHTGDNLTGEGDGDDESIIVNLKGVPSSIQYLAFTINSFRGQTFDQVENAFCRLVNLGNNEEVCRYTLSEKGSHTGVIMAVVYRQDEVWELKAIGAPCGGRRAVDISNDVVKFL